MNSYTISKKIVEELAHAKELILEQISLLKKENDKTFKLVDGINDTYMSICVMNKLDVKK